MLVIEPGMVIEGREEHPRKTLYPIVVTEFGMFTETKEEQLKKVHSGRVVIDSGRMASAKDEHPQKRQRSMFLTELGIVTEVKDLQSLKA